MSVLSLHNLSKAFSGVPVVNDTALEIASGEFFSILGPSGCGKTTLLRMIAGFEPPTSGRIVLDGEDITERAPSERRIGMVFQNYALFPHMTVAQNVSFGLEVAKVPAPARAERVRRILDAVRLGHKRDVSVTQLSGGEQQRVAVARALVVEPRVLLLDEPLSNLDVALRAETREEIRRLQELSGITALYVTHDQSEAMSLSDRIAVMNRGRIEQVDSPDGLYNRPANPFVASFVGGSSLWEATIEPGGTTLRVDQWQLSIPFPPANRHVGNCTLAVKPEAVEVAVYPESSHGTARVVSCEYLGFTSVLYLQVGDATVKAMCVTTTATQQLRPGELTGFRLDWSRCTIFPRDGGN